MLSSLGLEVMNSANPELNWKTVTKGRRSRKSVARSLNGFSPKRVGDFSGSDSDKFGDVVLGQSASGKSENVPLKKRRHLLQSPQPHPLASSIRHQDSATSITRSSSQLSENHDQLQYHRCSSGHRSSSWHLRGVEGSPKVGGGDGSDGLLCSQAESEYKLAGDFSGIELLAAAASMDVDPDNADKKDLHISMQKNPDASCSATLSKVGPKNESEDFSSNMKVYGGDMDTQQKNSAAASKSLCGRAEDESMPKVSRHHWDLNTLMDAWDEPSDDLIAGDTAKEVRDDMHMEGQKDSGDHVYSNAAGTRDECSDLNIEVNNSSSFSEDRICSEYPSLRENLQEQKNICPKAAREVSEQAGEKDLDDGNSIQVLNCDADMKNLNEVTSSDAVLDSSLFTKLCFTSGMLMSEQKANSIPSTAVIMQDEDCSSNVSECERGTVHGEICTKTQDVNSHLMVSESDIGISSKDIEDCRESSEPPGTFTKGVQPVLVADSNKQNDEVFISGFKIGDSLGLFEPAVDAKNEDNDHPNDELKRSFMEDTFNICSARAQSDNPTTSIETIGCLIDGQHVSDITQDNNDNVQVDEDDLTQQGYDSPYEDGELRGSFFCLLEDNEMENECVDYESDGRNGDGSDAADCLGSEIVEGGSESSHGTRRSLSLKVSPESKSMSTPIKHSVKDDSDNNEIAGKGSNAGSGTTVEQCMGVGVEEQDDMKRRQLGDRRDTVDEKVTNMDEYASKMMVRGKLQSRIEGRSSAEATNRKDVFFMQQCRPRRLVGSYSRAERDFSPDRYLGRYNRSTTHGERDGVHQWASSWGPKKRYASNYQGPDGRYPTRPRNKISESVDGVDFPDPGQTTHYLSKGPHRPLLRRSPVERDEYFGVGRRIAPTRGVGNYRSRGHYSQRGRDFVEDFEPLPDDDVRMPRYISRRDRSFSPSAGRSGHVALPRRRSRSRSRTRSPRPWHPQRERIFGARKHSRSPEFRSERVRLPLSKPSSDYGEDYYMPLPSSRGPQRNIRWVDDRNFVDTRRRRSPVRVFRRNQRFDGVGPSGRLKSDDIFRPVRPGRFSLMGNGVDPNYDDRRRGGDEGGEMMHHRAPQHSNERRFQRQNAAGDDDDLETNNLNSEDAGPQPQGDVKILT